MKKEESKENLFQKIFSLRDETRHKVLTICGLKIKLKRKLSLAKVSSPIKQGKIVFLNFHGKGYGCNPKYIAEEIIRQKLPYELVWLTSDIKEEFPKEIRPVLYGSIEGDYEFTTAQIIISNVRIGQLFNKYKKKNGQKYIQTWHGGTRFKKIENECIKYLDKKYIKNARIDSKNIDYFLSESKTFTKELKDVFFYNGEIYEVGAPRTDIFFNDTQEITNKIKNYYNISSDTKIALYAPTFRDNKDLTCYNLDYFNLLNTLKNKFGGNWVIISRLHPNISDYKDIVPDFVINGTDYPDVQELLAASDIVITDFSSLIFEFMLTNKPAFIFVTDKQKFEQERGGLYMPLEATPFPVAEDNQTLMENIMNFNEDEYKIKVDEFITKRGYITDGCGSKNVVELIKKIISEEGK